MTRTQALTKIQQVKWLNSNSKIKQNQSDDSNTGSDKDMANQSSLHQKGYQVLIE